MPIFWEENHLKHYKSSKCLIIDKYQMYQINLNLIISEQGAYRIIPERLYAYSKR